MTRDRAPSVLIIRPPATPGLPTPTPPREVHLAAPPALASCHAAIRPPDSRLLPSFSSPVTTTQHHPNQINFAYAKEKSSFVVADNRGAVPLELKDMKRYNRILKAPGTRTEVARFIAPSTGEPVVIFKHDDFEIETITLRDAERRESQIRNQYVENFSRVFRNTSIQEENEFQTRILSYCHEGLFSADYLVSRGKKEGQNITAYYWNSQVFAWLADTAEVRDGLVVKTNKLSDFWNHSDLPKSDLANEGGVEFRRGKKPEMLLRRLLKLVTKPGDWVLDSFAGSGTTGAVAHKMGRRWIMVELGEHCHTHIQPRLKKVIDGADPGGVTDAVGWRGGGGFRYYRLAPSLLKTDKWGNLVINREFNPAMLAEAVCKLEGYTYAPSATLYWQHGHAADQSFIYVTTQHLSRAQLTQLNAEVGAGRALLVCCGAFRGKAENFPHLEIKKIPAAVLAKCEWDHDDYSLEVENLPKAPPKPGQQDLFAKAEGQP
jgi:adenine-specific DNA-methyltransferase